MSNYTKTTNFATKDSLASGNPNKIVKGTEINSEFDNIATAVATKANTASPSLTGTVTAAALNVTGNLDVDGTLEFDSMSGTGSVAVTDIADEDNMSSDSATKLATQQSIKAYVDSQVTAQDLDLTDGSTSISIDLDSEALSVLGGTGVTSTASGNGVTLAIDSTVTTLTGSQTLTNKTLTSPDVNTPDIDGGTIDGAVIGGSSAAAGSFTTVGATGNITVGGTVEGRDVATDGTKLDGIEASATADQSNAEIRTAVEAASDSNVFTDADHTKLNAIEASADVTDATNVTAAGALMDSELTSIASVKALNQGVATTDSPQFVGITSTANVIVGGNLTVNGTTTTLNTATLDVEDKNITINYGAGDTTGSANGAGITIQDAVDASTDATILWDTTNDEFDFSHPINVAGTSVFASLDISGDIDVDGTTNLDVVDIDGAVDMATTLAVAGNVDFNGDLDVDGTTNLDVVDIDGAVDMASTLAVAGVVTANAGVKVDNFTLDGTTLALSSGDMNIDAVAAINFNSDSGNFRFQDGAVDTAIFQSTGSNFIMRGLVADRDLAFHVNDGGVERTALTLDGSAAGAATFYAGITATSLDISGDIDVDGVTNLDVVDIDGAVALGGNITAADGIEVQLGADNDMGLFSSSGQSHIRVNSGIFKLRADDMRFTSQDQTEHMRLTGDGTLMVGTSQTDVGYTDSGAGASIDQNGVIQSARSSVNANLYLNKLDNDGEMINLRKDGITVGSIQSGSGGRLALGHNDTGLYFADDLNAVVPWDVTGNVVRDSAISLGSAGTNFRFKDAYLSGGIYLGGTGAANKLDDYEEGTFTPTLAVGSGSVTYSARLGTYTKVGNLVNCTLAISLSAISSPSGTAYLSGLPFANSVGEGYVSSISVGIARSFSSALNITGYVGNGATTITVGKNTAASGHENIVGADLTANTVFYISLTYSAA